MKSAMFRAVLLWVSAALVAASAQTHDSSDTSIALRLDGVPAASGRLVVFDGPDATQTYASAIDNQGFITGIYADTANAEHVYLRSSKGLFETFSAPGSPDITPDSINSAGIVAGSYGDTREDGFVRKPDGIFTTFTVPGIFPSTSTNPIVINNSGAVAGPYFDANGKEHGFVQLKDGALLPSIIRIRAALMQQASATVDRLPESIWTLRSMRMGLCVNRVAPGSVLTCPVATSDFFSQPSTSTTAVL